MKIDFTKKLTGLDGKVMVAEGEELTLGTVATNVLLATLADGHGTAEQLPGDAKAKNALLALEIHGAKKALEIKVEDVALLKARIGRACPPLVVMRAWALLEASGEDA